MNIIYWSYKYGSGLYRVFSFSWVFITQIILLSKVDWFIPVARNVLNLYKNQLNFSYGKILKGEHIHKVVIVDTRTSNRIKEYFEFTDYTISDVEEVVIYDHHEADCCDIKNAILRTENLGANVSILVKTTNCRRYRYIR